MRSIATLGGVIVLLGSLAGPLHAGVPSPSNSTVDPCLVLCPGGDIPFTVVVRDVANVPVANSTVEIDLCDCPDVHTCPSFPGGGTHGDQCNYIKSTDASGAVTFDIRGGGLCLTGAIIRADGVVLAMRPVASPDQDGNLFVNFGDNAILATKIGGNDPTGDLDCDQAVSAGDQTVLAAHFGHSCDVITPVRPSSWGRIKTIYR